MPTNRVHQFCILCGLSALLIGEALASTPVTPNLLVNGDAEAQRCTVDWTAQTSVPGWRVTRGAASVLCYAAFDYTGETPVLPGSGSGGAALFTAPGADTAMEQSVDVSAAAAAIDHGTVGFTLSGWLGGWDARPESASHPSDENYVAMVAGDTFQFGPVYYPYNLTRTSAPVRDGLLLTHRPRA